jgi:hypothetical protein
MRPPIIFPTILPTTFTVGPAEHAMTLPTGTVKWSGVDGVFLDGQAVQADDTQWLGHVPGFADASAVNIDIFEYNESTSLLVSCSFQNPFSYHYADTSPIHAEVAGTLQDLPPIALDTTTGFFHVEFVIPNPHLDPSHPQAFAYAGLRRDTAWSFRSCTFTKTQ